MDEFRNLFHDFLPYDAFGATVIDTGNGNIDWGNALFSKFPIQNCRTIFFDLPLTSYDFNIDFDPRLASEGMLAVDFLIDDKKVTVGSWHGVWDHHGGDTEKRALMVEKIISGLKGNNPLILAGDTNMNPNSEGIKKIIHELELKSVFGNTLQSTFNMSQKENPGNYANSPVDMVFLSRDFAVLKKEMPIVDISDHYPLVVELDL